MSGPWSVVVKGIQPGTMILAVQDYMDPDMAPQRDIRSQFKPDHPSPPSNERVLRCYALCTSAEHAAENASLQQHCVFLKSIASNLLLESSYLKKFPPPLAPKAPFKVSLACKH